MRLRGLILTESTTDHRPGKCGARVSSGCFCGDRWDREGSRWAESHGGEGLCWRGVGQARAQVQSQEAGSGGALLTQLPCDMGLWGDRLPPSSLRASRAMHSISKDLQVAARRLFCCFCFILFLPEGHPQPVCTQGSALRGFPLGCQCHLGWTLKRVGMDPLPPCHQ